MTELALQNSRANAINHGEPLMQNECLSFWQTEMSDEEIGFGYFNLERIMNHVIRKDKHCLCNSLKFDLENDKFFKQSNNVLLKHSHTSRGGRDLPWGNTGYGGPKMPMQWHQAHGLGLLPTDMWLPAKNTVTFRGRRTDPSACKPWKVNDLTAQGSEGHTKPVMCLSSFSPQVSESEELAGWKPHTQLTEIKCSVLIIGLFFKKIILFRIFRKVCLLFPWSHLDSVVS